jgi:hypothetical protein
MLGCIQPISSPMMKRMFGLPFGCASAEATPHASTNAPNHATNLENLE